VARQAGEGLLRRKLEPQANGGMNPPRASGPDRLLWGSDWPVSSILGDYESVYQAMRSAVASLSDKEAAQVFGGTAWRYYRLSDAPTL
jgi:Amidohydrolase